MASLGQFNQLTILEKSDKGLVLDGQAFGQLFLPNKQVPTLQDEQSTVEVFLYRDASEQITATTSKPFVQAEQFAYLRVKQTNKLGAFLDWGLPKDLLVPFNLQYRKMEQGKSYLVYVFVDETTGRLVASSKLDKFLDIWPADYQQWQEVDIVIGGKTDLGFKAIINHKHWGLLYQNEIFKPLRVGQKLKAFIKNVREDGRLDLSLSRAGKSKVVDFNTQLLNYLKQHDGYCHIHDKSTPAEISKTFGVSKKTYKAAVGNLLKQGKVTLSESGIHLV
ncbi:S1-like domain-containing RNA-binding protein [Thalassotalea sp. 1_MG-2023]|uniref:CvfB family protein n=1 Tax=Thalassotalea sp. 1_MG-2023 TaxID=3062680 RepID=UPI0026E34129|nr:S1-like domain-containing RNA-binding protein [Thalassotalea sp. 1_MG-2023]MDO6426316.1 S1-like domain-containing RNA-binding protein [Thalassotalea sp. 1_MG-2023]